jgi:hypothetical protein
MVTAISALENPEERIGRRIERLGKGQKRNTRERRELRV